MNVTFMNAPTTPTLESAITRSVVCHTLIEQDRLENKQLTLSLVLLRGPIAKVPRQRTMVISPAERRTMTKWVAMILIQMG